MKKRNELQVGDKVIYDAPDSEDHGSKGVVIDRDYCAFKVEWSDGMVCAYKFSHTTSGVRPA